jgi:hypothetical protein
MQNVCRRYGDLCPCGIHPAATPPFVIRPASQRGGSVRPQIPTPGKNRQVTPFGAIVVTAGVWTGRLGRRCAATGQWRGRARAWYLSESHIY